MTKTDRTGDTTELETTGKPRAAWRDGKSHARLWPILAAGLAADLATKGWALRRLMEPDGVTDRPIEVIDGIFRLALVHNPGAVFGIAAGATGMLIAISVLALGFMLYMFAHSRADQWLCHISLGMLLGGALGNIHDRLFQGGLVTDFIEVNLGFWPANPWPSFNIADSLLCTGVGLLMLHLIRAEKKEKAGQIAE